MWDRVYRLVAGRRASGNDKPFRRRLLSDHDHSDDDSSINCDTPSPEWRQQKLHANVTASAMMPPVPDFESKVYTCDPCQKARKDAMYPTRLAMLLKPMYCSECESDHAAIFFSHKQRAVDAQFRKCICHEGYRSICPHIQVYLSDITRHQGATTTTITCKEACEWHQTTVSFANGKMDFQSTTFSHRIDLSLLSDDAQVPLGLRLLRAMHSFKSPVFCPHRRASKNPFSDEHFQFSKIAKWSDDFVTLVCNAGCCDWVSYSIKEESKMCATASGGVFDLDKVPIHHGRWQKSLEPASFGLFSDPQSKNVVWCEDKSCSTSLELARFDIVKGIALLEEKEGLAWSMTSMRAYWKLADENTLRRLENVS